MAPRSALSFASSTGLNCFTFLLIARLELLHSKMKLSAYN
jgi:hypothetical protein